MILPSRRRGLSAAVTFAAAVGGAIVAVHYHRLGLTLSHYDSRGHLIVARRVIDSLTPGWQQIGAVWLPLPHLLNLLPVQVDALYRSGASAVAISVVSFAIATAALAWIIAALTGSPLAALSGAAVFAFNPNVLYLQATPMTEPLLLALTTTAVALLIEWCAVGRPGSAPPSRGVGIVFALACLTRYEAWPVTAAALSVAVWVRWRQGDPLALALRRVAGIALYPAAAGLAFVVFSRIVIGHWFVSAGFFVPENKALGNPLLAAAEIVWGAHALSGYLMMIAAAAGIAPLLLAGLFRRERADGLIALSLLATAALPWSAFVNGHPFRIRYMVPLIAIEAVGAGCAAGALASVTRLRLVLPLVLLAAIGYELRPLDAAAPMVVEAQWDRPNAPVRQTVTDCLRAGYRGDTIMASMGSLGHYMQEASHDGFAIRDFLHEGNGDLWLAALDGPRPFVGWVLIEEKANGGDVLAKRARENPSFLDGFSRVCEGAGLALYRRNEAGAPVRTAR